MTHKFVTRFPPELWEQLDRIAKTNKCSVNTLVINTLSSALSENASVSWTTTVQYLPTSSFAWQSSGTTSSASPKEGSKRDSLLAEARELLADEDLEPVQ